MVCCFVDDGVVGNVFFVVNYNCLKVDKYKQCYVCYFLQWEDEGEDVIWQVLCVVVKRVEGVVGKGCGYDLFVVRFVEVFVYLGVVKVMVNLVDVKVGEEEEEGDLELVLLWLGGFVECVVEEVVILDFGDEEGGGVEGYDGYGFVGLFDFELDLVFEEFGVFKGFFVEDEEVGEGGEDEVDQEVEDFGEGGLVLFVGGYCV